METYTIKHIEDGRYAIATNKQGLYGVLSGYETINTDNGEIVFVPCGIACPFEYSNIVPSTEEFYMIGGDINNLVKYTTFLLRVGKKEGLFSTLYGAIVLKPVPKETYCIIARAATEGLVGCLKKSKDNYGLRRTSVVFLDFDGVEVIVLDKKWRGISQGFQGGTAYISSSSSREASIDKNGVIENERRVEDVGFSDESPYDIDRMYRSAFEDDPAAEWNID